MQKHVALFQNELQKDLTKGQMQMLPLKASIYYIDGI